MIGVFDGASRGNPGPAGCGAALLDDDGTVLWRCAWPLGTGTNNQAEWTALKLLVDEIERRGLKGLTVQGDSQLVVKQACGEWKINKPELAAIADQVMPRIRALNLRLKWVRREENKIADALSNDALDGKSTPREGVDRADFSQGGTADEGLPEEGRARRCGDGWVFTVGGGTWFLDPQHNEVKPYKKR